MYGMKNEFAADRELRNVQNLFLRPNTELASLTSMGTRATASMLAVPLAPGALVQLVRIVRERQWPMLMLGGGTNTIFATRHFEGIVTLLDPEVFGGMEAIGNNMVRVGAAAELGGLLNYVRRQNLMGLEFCTMIPGRVGGALAGNAGAGNWGICDFVERALVLTRSGRLIDVKRGEFRYTYRHSELSEGIVLEADLLLEPLNPQVSQDRVREYRDKKKCQPYKVNSSGCIFKNPRDSRTGQKISAGKLIDDAGLKGYSINDVTVSDLHANFIVNRGGACGEDFLAMISLIQDIVHERFGVELELEARIVGGPLTSCVLR